LASAVVEILVFFGFRSLFVLVSTFCFGWCFDSVRLPFLFFALVFVLVVLGVVVVVVVVVFSPLLFGGGVCLRGFIDVFGSVFFVAYGLL
jgi:hypothetical protein